MDEDLTAIKTLNPVSMNGKPSLSVEVREEAAKKAEETGEVPAYLEKPKTKLPEGRMTAKDYYYGHQAKYAQAMHPSAQLTDEQRQILIDAGVPIQADAGEQPTQPTQASVVPPADPPHETNKAPKPVKAAAKK